MPGNEFAERLGENFSPKDIRLVLEVFSRDLARLTEELVPLAAAGEVKPFRKICHALAGACGTVGALGVERVCRAAMVRPDLAPAGLAAECEAVRRAARGVRAEMDAYLASLPPD